MPISVEHAPEGMYTRYGEAMYDTSKNVERYNMMYDLLSTLLPARKKEMLDDQNIKLAEAQAKREEQRLELDRMLAELEKVKVGSDAMIGLANAPPVMVKNGYYGGSIYAAPVYQSAASFFGPQFRSLGINMPSSSSYY